MASTKKNKNLVIVSLLIIVIFGSFFDWNNRKEETSSNEFNISTGKIIAEIANDHTVDVIVKDRDNIIFYSYELISNGKEYKQLFSNSAKYYFDYEARKNLEGESSETFEKALKDHLQVMNTFYKNLSKDRERNPYYGVSVSPKIKKLRVNNHLVDKIIEYKDGDYLFYIWYFSDLSIDPENIIITVN